MECKESGVFSPCDNMDSASMIKCLQALLCDYPSIKFNSITTDKKCKGFKIFFTEPQDSIVLEKNVLASQEQLIWIYPLRANFVILDVDHKKTSLFKRDLCDAIEKKIGKVTAVEKIPCSRQSNDWHIEVDIPEFQDLEIFKTTSSFQIVLPERNEEVTLKFLCKQCKMCGHFKHECFDTAREQNHIRHAMKLEENGNDARQVGENSWGQAGSSAHRNFERTPMKVSNISLEATEKYAEKIGREEVMSKHLQNNTNENAERSLNNNLPTGVVIKQEPQEIPQDSDTKEYKNPRNDKSGNTANNSNWKDVSSDNVNSVNKSQNSHLDDDDDDIRFIERVDYSPADKSPSTTPNSPTTAGGRNIEEESRSPERCTAFPNFSFSATAGFSHKFSPTAVKSPRGAEVTTSLSERLQDCINQVCDSAGILDRKKLDAFLIHVKKKSNPIRVALNYTANTRGLKDQLQKILDMYYNTPQTGTKEDMQFIKWLNGLVERYDGSIPKKRKRKNDDDPSAKR